MDEDCVRKALDVEFSINERTATGGPAPKAIITSIKKRDYALNEDTEWIKSLKTKTDNSIKTMINMAEELIG